MIDKKILKEKIRIAAKLTNQTKLFLIILTTLGILLLPLVGGCVEKDELNIRKEDIPVVFDYGYIFCTEVKIQTRKNWETVCHT